MMLGALIGLGAPIEDVRSGLQSLAVDGWSLAWETTLRCSLSSGRALVTSNEDHHHRTWSSIDAMLASSELPEQVRVGSRATFRRLGEVEAGIHGVTIDEVHFHEVGAVDAIVDIVGSWLALHLLNIDTVISGPVGLGSGSVTAAHGRLPVPAPATTELLLGATIKPVDIEAETVTPTGAALVATMSNHWAAIPAGRLIGSSRGAGGRDPVHYPNVLSAYLIAESSPEAAATTPLAASTADLEGAQGVIEESVLISTNLDDVTAEIVGHTITRCLAAGADDAWATPIVMKKNRPGVELSVLCSPDLLEQLSTLVFSETATLGLRTRTVAKRVLPRRFEEVTVREHTIRIKIGPYGVKPEYEDLAKAAEALKLPVRTLSAEATAAFLSVQKNVSFPR